MTKLQVEQNVVEPNLKVAVHPQAMRESNVLQPDFHQKICELSWSYLSSIVLILSTFQVVPFMKINAV